MYIIVLRRDRATWAQQVLNQALAGLDCLKSGLDCLIYGIDCLISGLDCLACVLTLSYLALAGLDCLMYGLDSRSWPGAASCVATAPRGPNRYGRKLLATVHLRNIASGLD